MYFVTAQFKIKADRHLKGIADLVSGFLSIPPFVEDTSGRYEELPVWVSESIGLTFGLCQPEGCKENEYEFSVEPSLDLPEFDGNETEIDATKYFLWLLKQIDEITCEEIEAD